MVTSGEGYLYGIRSIQIVALKESVRGNDFINCYSGSNHSLGITAAGQIYTWGANTMHQLGSLHPTLYAKPKHLEPHPPNLTFARGSPPPFIGGARPWVAQLRRAPAGGPLEKWQLGGGVWSRDPVESLGLGKLRQLVA